MSITSFLESRAQEASTTLGSPFGLMPLDQQFLRIEKAIDFLDTAKNIHTAASKWQMTGEEIRFSNHVLNGAPQELIAPRIRMESYKSDTGGLKYRAEGIIDSIVDGIASFFRWIGDAFSKLFGGSGDSASGGAGASAAATSTAETVSQATSGGTDEFLFKADHRLFKVMNLNDLAKCRSFYDAVAKSTKALVDINAKAIELSKKGSKDYQGNFAKDVVTELKGYAVGKTVSYAKQGVPNTVQDGSYFAYPVEFLKSRVIVFEESKINLPGVNEADGSSADDKSGEGYTPKDVYIKASEWKSLVDTLAGSGKLFYDAMSDLSKMGGDYAKLSEMIKGWTSMETEEVRNVSQGLKEMNKVASFAFKAVKHQASSMDKLFKDLRDIAENDLRNQAKAGRKSEADAKEAEKASKAAAAGQSNVAPTPGAGAHTYAD